MKSVPPFKTFFSRKLDFRELVTIFKQSSCCWFITNASLLNHIKLNAIRIFITQTFTVNVFHYSFDCRCTGGAHKISLSEDFFDKSAFIGLFKVSHKLSKIFFLDNKTRIMIGINFHGQLDTWNTCVLKSSSYSYSITRDSHMFAR